MEPVVCEVRVSSEEERRRLIDDSVRRLVARLTRERTEAESRPRLDERERRKRQIERTRIV